MTTLFRSFIRSHRLGLQMALVPSMVCFNGWAQAADAPALERRVNDLDQQLKILSRKLENAQEEAVTKAKDGVQTKVPADGFRFTSADGAYALKVGGWVQADARLFANNNNNGHV